jgi:hypothetical protein
MPVSGACVTNEPLETIVIKMMRKTALSLVVILCFLSPVALRAQYYFYNDKYYESDLLFEAGVSGGIMNCFTDLGGRKGVGKKFIKDVNMKNTRLSGGVYVTAMYKNVIGLRLEGTFGQVKAYDSILKGDQSLAKQRYERNLNFRSNITEVSAMFEIHPMFFKVNDDQDPPRISPYVMGGVGMFSFNPQGNLNNTWVNLEPLRTEGQGFSQYPDRKRYKLRQMNIPFGAGVRYELNSMLNARFEIVHRVLFTDYLDDVSKAYIDPVHFISNLTPNQAALATRLSDRRAAVNPAIVPLEGQIRGDSRDNDAYFSINLKVGITLGRQRIK